MKKINMKTGFQLNILTALLLVALTVVGLNDWHRFNKINDKNMVPTQKIAASKYAENTFQIMRVKSSNEVEVRTQKYSNKVAL